jgi:hypothetical protein
MSDPLKVLGVEPNKTDFPQIKTVLIKSIDGKLNKIKVSTSDEEENIEKSISDSSCGFNFDKLGSEIKANLIKKKQEEETNKQIQLQNIISLIKQIGFEPTVPCPSYDLRGLALNPLILPKKYDYSSLSENEGSISDISLRSNILTPEKEIDNKKLTQLIQNYNQIYIKYIDCLIEISYIEALILNLVDDQIYPLTAKQLINFGF